jgi:hypothetical protein
MHIGRVVKAFFMSFFLDEQLRGNRYTVSLETMLLCGRGEEIIYQRWQLLKEARRGSAFGRKISARSVL